MKVGDADEAFLFIVHENFLYVGMHSTRVVEENLLHSQLPDQLEPLHQSLGEILVQVVKGRAADTNAPLGRRTAIQNKINILTLSMS